MSAIAILFFDIAVEETMHPKSQACQYIDEGGLDMEQMQAVEQIVEQWKGNDFWLFFWLPRPKCIRPWMMPLKNWSSRALRNGLWKPWRSAGISCHIYIYCHGFSVILMPGVRGLFWRCFDGYINYCKPLESRKYEHQQIRIIWPFCPEN